MKKTYTVIIILEAKTGKEQALKELLVSVIAPSRAETTCLTYRLHQALNNPSQFILYENWESQEAHLKQFQKPYITVLANQLDNLLAKPYQVFLAEEI